MVTKPGLEPGGTEFDSPVPDVRNLGGTGFDPCHRLRGDAQVRSAVLQSAPVRFDTEVVHVVGKFDAPVAHWTECLATN